MLLKINQVNHVTFQVTMGATVASYVISVNGGGGSTGGGTIFTTPNPGITICQIALPAVECAVLGELAVIAVDAGGNLVGVIDCTVCTDLPGGPVPAGSLVPIADAVLNTPDLVESGLTVQNCLRCLFAVLAGKDAIQTVGATFRNFGDTKTRVTMTFDSNGQRTAVTYDFS